MPNARALELPAFDHRGPGAVGGVRDGQVGLVIVGQVDAAGRQAPERPAAGEHDVEERGRVVGVREPAGEADNGERTGWPHDSGRPGGGGRVSARRGHPRRRQ